MEKAARSDRLAKKIQGFKGYRRGRPAEADWLLRRFLAGEVEKVRDRLAEFIAAGSFPAALRENLGLSLRTVAFLKDELSPAVSGEEPEEPLNREQEERLFDFDLALDARIAALRAPLESMEAAAGPVEIGRALEVFDEGLAEVDDLFRSRRRLWEESGGGG